jgi:pimeloyl-ACP methyl ester carboxylesterase
VKASRIPVAEGVALNVLRWDGDPDRVPFVLVHGLASNARLWDGVSEELARRGHPVAAVDQRGHGRSDKPDDGYDFATITSDLATVVDALGLAQPPLVAGQSWGGNVVVELAARHPDVARSIACIDGGWISFRHFGTWDEVRERLAPPKTEGRAATDVDDMLRRMHPDWPESGIQGALACFEIRADGTVAPWLTLHRHLAILRAMWEEDLADIHPKVAVPALLVPCESGDPAWTERKRREVTAAEQRIPVSRTQWFTADHDVHAQHPVEVADLLVRSTEDGFWS